MEEEGDEFEMKEGWIEEGWGGLRKVFEGGSKEKR